MISRIMMKLRLASQKCYGRNKIRYIFEKHRNSDLLVVVFSGFSRPDEPARFNYIRTLAPLKVNKLFILDDFGYKNRGSYYLTGHQGDEHLQEEICSLIIRHRERKKLVTAGSSKGGSAALLYGLKCEADAIIAGAPQYHIGNYLAEEEHIKILEGICGDTSEASVQKLNLLLPDQIQAAGNPSKTAVYIHCSPLEHIFEEHVKDLLAKLEDCGFAVHKDLNDSYFEHSKDGQYFSGYLCSILRKIAEEA